MPALQFTVRRRPAMLVAPAAPTPHELKRLSDIDDQERLRLQVPLIHFYKMKESMSGKDPAMVIRDAVSRALVPYYPFAGRLREIEDGKLAVDCTGEGVLFVEADADVHLENFGNALLPPFPCLEELISDIPGSSGILNTPLLLIQVTRLACRGFCLALRLNHTMADGHGIVQFLGAAAELARGALEPTVRPVWERELLEARRPPQLGSAHRMLNEEAPNIKSTIIPLDDMAHRFLFFGPREVAAIRVQLTPHLQKTASKFDIILGCLWKCRAAALALDPSEEMRLICMVNARGRKTTGVGIPTGYYGNAFTGPIATSTAGELRAKAFSYAVELVKKAKDEVDMEYMRSLADLMVLRKGRSFVPVTLGTYVVSDITKARFSDLDFGWGRPVYGGTAQAVASTIVPWFASFLLPFKNAKGEDGIVVPTYLPGPAMNKFEEELGKLLYPPTNVSKLQQCDVYRMKTRSAL